MAWEWPSLTPRIYNPNKPMSKAISRREAQANPNPGLPSPELGAMRILEMRLIHQWVTETCNTMSSAQVESVRKMWGVSVPQLAFEYEPLLHTLLALGAAHRATLLPQEASSLRPVYHGYIDSAIRRHRPVTANLDKNVTEAVCMNTVLLSLYALFLRSEPSAAPYDAPVMWLSLAHGIQTVLKTVYDQLITNNSPLCPLLQAQPAIWKSADRAQRVYNGPMKPLQFLLHYRQGDDCMDSATFAVYEEGIAYLERFYIDVQKGSLIMYSGACSVASPRLFLRPSLVLLLRGGRVHWLSWLIFLPWSSNLRIYGGFVGSPSERYKALVVSSQLSGSA